MLSGESGGLGTAASYLGVRVPASCLSITNEGWHELGAKAVPKATYLLTDQVFRHINTQLAKKKKVLLKGYCY